MVTNLAVSRIAYLDLVKCVAIWLVLWGHAITQLMNHELGQNPAYVFIYSFHMPLFMMVSGFFARSSFKLTAKELVWKKFKQLIWPALIFGALWYGTDLLLGNREFSVMGVIRFEAEAYWFLKSLFFAYLIGYLAFKCGRYKWLAIIASCALFCLLQLRGQTFFKMGNMLPFFYLGMFIKEWIPWIHRNKYIWMLIALVIFACAFYFYSLDYAFAVYFFKTLTWESLGNWMYYLLVGLSGSLMVITACMIICEKLGETSIVRALSKIGQHTLSIYLLQKLLLEILLPHFWKVEMNLWIFDLAFTPFIAFVFLFICYGITKLIKQNCYTKALFLGEF